MRYRDFLGRRASVIALGTMYYGARFSEEMSFEQMDAYVEMGGNFIDTARLYGDFDNRIVGISEKTIGRWMDKRGNRDDIILSTKGAHPHMDHMDVSRLDKESLYDDMARSLEALRTDHVDIYWLHRDDTSLSVAGIMETLNEFVEKGYALHLGASNWTAKRMAEANAFAAAHGMKGFEADQPQFSLCHQHHVTDPTLIMMDDELYSFHKNTGMPVMAFSSQGKGYFSKLAAGDEISAELAARYENPVNRRRYEKLKALSQQTGHSVGALALAYLTCQPFATFPIAGASRLSQMEQMKEAGDIELSPQQVAYLAE